MGANKNERSRLILSDGEFALMDVIWENEPMPSRDMAAIAEERFGWAKTTTYTMLKRLTQRGVAVNNNAVVTALIARDEAQVEDSKRIGEQARKRFGGSLPRFLTTFVNSNEMSKDELDEVLAAIERRRNEM